MYYIDKIAYWADPNSVYKHTNTFLQFRKETLSLVEAECVVLTVGLLYGIESENELTKFLLKYNDKHLIIDGTFETIPGDSYQWIKKNAVNYTIYSNGINHIEKYIIQNNNLNIQPYFISNIDLYKPIEPEISLYPKKKAFLYMVGKSKVHRIKLLKELFKENLIKEGHISYFLDDELNFDLDSKYKNSPKLLEYFEDKPKYMKLDIDSFSSEVSHTKYFNREFYDASDFVLVTEAFYGEPIFLTEKVGKCILLDKKFILLGPINALATLKTYCLKYLNKDISHLTDWVDTSYDSETNLDKKIDCIIEQVKIGVDIYNNNKKC